MHPRTHDSNLTVCIVDDAAGVRSRLQRLVAALPHVGRVLECGDGPSALATIERERPALVTLDLQMAGMTGLELLQRLAARPDSPAVVVLTNYADDAYRRAALALGARAFLDKSLDIDRLPDVVGALLAEHAADALG